MANKRFFQEKFQFMMPEPSPGPGYEWGTQKSARRVFISDNPDCLNELPFGHLQDPATDFGTLDFGGSSSEDSQINSKSLLRGYNRGELLPTDDNHYNEHARPFYATVEGEDGVGFVERNNNLDRL